MNHVKRCQFIYTNNKRKEYYFNPRFENFSVIVLDPMHMKCGRMSETSVWLQPTTLNMGARYYTSKILGDRIIFVKVVRLYSCRPVIHIHVGHHYIPTWGLHARRECYWPSLNAMMPPDLGAMSLNSKLLPPSPVVTVSPGAGGGMLSSAPKFSHRGRGRRSWRRQSTAAPSRHRPLPLHRPMSTTRTVP
jgi:hypothetical protein